MFEDVDDTLCYLLPAHTNWASQEFYRTLHSRSLKHMKVIQTVKGKGSDPLSWSERRDRPSLFMVQGGAWHRTAGFLGYQARRGRSSVGDEGGGGETAVCLFTKPPPTIYHTSSLPPLLFLPKLASFCLLLLRSLSAPCRMVYVWEQWAEIKLRGAGEC